MCGRYGCVEFGSGTKTVANIETRKAFTLAVPGVDTLKESDFFGIATANKIADKFERSGLHAMRSERVDAPVITEYPVTIGKGCICCMEQIFRTMHTKYSRRAL